MGIGWGGTFLELGFVSLLDGASGTGGVAKNPARLLGYPMLDVFVHSSCVSLAGCLTWEYEFGTVEWSLTVFVW